MNDRTKSRRPVPLVPVAAEHLLRRPLGKGPVRYAPRQEATRACQRLRDGACCSAARCRHRGAGPGDRAPPRLGGEYPTG